MEPRIQYAKTADGVSIAYSAIGEGTPFVHMPPNEFSHIQMEWRVPQLHAWYEGLAEKRMLVRYDGRETGLSDRDASDFSLEAHVLDLEAVVDRLGLEKFALFGGYDFGPVAIAYAARHPERVSHLILFLAHSRGSDESSGYQAIIELRERDWNLYTDAVAGLFGGQPDEVAAVAAWLRECVTPETAKAIHNASREFDAASLLPKVTSPTLVFHPRHYPFHDLNVSKNLAAQIPDARLMLLEGSSPFVYVGDNLETVMDAIDEFLCEGEEAAGEIDVLDAGAFRTILFTDVEGSTALTQRLGDAKARVVLREHERIVREALKAHGGAEVKTMGDGFMVSFSSATKALECAVAMQRAFAEHNRGVGAALAPPQGAASDAPTGPAPTEPLHIRIGLNAGEPIAEDDPDGRSDLFGTAVIMAARIAGKAKGGEILASDAVRQIVAGKGFFFSDRGEEGLHGFEEPVRLYEVRWRD